MVVEPFHSAVNRIPVLRPLTTQAAALGNLSQDLFADGPAPTHDHLAPDLWSGSIDLEMTVRTPLVFGEQCEENGRTYVELPTDGDGNLVMPPTMVKGMISRAYETLTCSRFRVFGDVENPGGFRRTADDHSVPLTYRADPAAANGLLPGRICETDDGGLGVEILDGFGKNAQVALIRDDLNDGHGTIVRTDHPGIKAGPGGKLNDQQVFTRFCQLTPHGKEVEVEVTQWEDSKGKSHLMVTGVWVGNNPEVFFDVQGSRVKRFNVWGYPCRTSPEGKTAHELFAKKTYERFFFKSDRDGTSLDGLVFPLTDAQVSRYATVLRSYRDQQKAPGGDKHLLNRAANTTDTARPLSVGDLVFVKLSAPNPSAQKGTANTAQVVDVFPTMVGRRSYDTSPRKLAEAQEILPPTSKGQASATDRLFGYVVPNAAKDAKDGDVAARGRIAFGPVDGSQARISTKEKLLSPLLAPKPSSARRFLTDRSGATPKNKDNGTLRRDSYFTDGQQLGTAAYPVHRRLLNGKDLDSDGFPKQATRAAVLDCREQANDAVRLTVRRWIKPGSTLRCTMNFTNLSEDELGALVWVLTPENLVPSEERKKAGSGAVGYLRMGLGKPLGLGVVEVRIAPNRLRARNGNDLAASYEELSECLGESETAVPTSRFPLRNEDTLIKTPWVQAMQRAAYGYSDDHPVHHMSLEENKSNNLTDSKTGEPQQDRGIAPQDLFGSDSAKPIHVPRQQRPKGGGHHNTR